MSEDLVALSHTVGILRDEVLRLRQAVSQLEAHAAGRSVRIRDYVLTVAGVLVSAASVLWMLQTLGVVS